MAQLDVLIRNGTVATAADVSQCDVAISSGKVVALGRDLGAARRTIDAAGMLVLPGGVEGHCHIEQMGSLGVMTADDFYSGTVAAVFGGTTSILSFAAQHRGQSLRKAVDDYMARAVPKAVIDYGFHLIISDPTPQVLGQELPALIKDGFSSFKVYMTYDKLALADIRNPRSAVGRTAPWRLRPGPRREPRHDQSGCASAWSSAVTSSRDITRSAIPALGKAKRPIASSPCPGWPMFRS